MGRSPLAPPLLLVCAPALRVARHIDGGPKGQCVRTYTEDRMASKRARSGSDARPAKRARTGSVTRKAPAYFGRQAGEVKFFDTANSFLVDVTGEVPATGQLVLIPQGVTESTRVGRKCVIKSIQMRGTALYQPGAGAQMATMMYMYVIQDKQANGAAAAVTDVFTSADLSVAHHNLANSQRFVVLKKIEIPFNGTAGVTTAYCNQIRKIDFFKKCNIPLEFSSTAGAITELKSNNIFLIAGVNAAGGDDATTVVGTTRVRFSDGS